MKNIRIFYDHLLISRRASYEGHIENRWICNEKLVWTSLIIKWVSRPINTHAIQNWYGYYIDIICRGKFPFNFRQLGSCCLFGGRRTIIFLINRSSDTQQSPFWREFLTRWTGWTGGNITHQQRRKFHWLHITRSHNGYKENKKTKCDFIILFFSTGLVK